MTRVLVTDAGRGSALSIIRALGRRGIEVVAADANERSAGFVSRYATDRLVYPHPATRSNEAVDALLTAAKKHRIDLIVPVGEDFVLLLSRARRRFAGITTLALPDEESLAATHDKHATIQLAKRLGVPTPRTFLVETAADAERRVSEFSWPIVLKPQASRSMRNGQVDDFCVTYARDLPALVGEMRTFEGRSPVLLQEYCEGEAHGVGLLMNGGNPLLAFQYRRLREWPTTGGPSSFRESVPLERTLFDYSVGMLGALNWTGLAMVEFKLTADGPRLMEINGRIWGSFALAVKSGVDLPGRMVDLYLSNGGGSTGEAGFSYSPGVRLHDLRLEIAWIAYVLAGKRGHPYLKAPRRREALRAALELLSPRGGFDSLSRDDIRPAVADLRDVAGRVGRRLRPARSR
jgi:predicted ATP-grasp superfamily ATP-dependent carboligase